MSLQTHITQGNPAGETDVVILQLNHDAWGAALWYVDDVVPWSFDDENGDPVTAQALGLDADGEPTDDTGIDSRQVTVPDPALILRKLLENLSQTGDTRPVVGTFYRYLSTGLTAPAVYAVLAMVSPSFDGRLCSFELSNANVLNRDAPTRRFTYSNSPGLRR